MKTVLLGDVISEIRNGVNCLQNKGGVGEKITRIETISEGHIDLSRVGYCDLGSLKSKYRLQRGDVLFSHINSPIHVGKTAIFNDEAELYHGVNLLLLRSEKLYSGYLQYYLTFLFRNGYWRHVCKQSVNQASVNQQDIKRVPISYPESIEEQKRIVAKLDEAFAAIDKAKANTEKNQKNVQDIFKSTLNGVFTNTSGVCQKNILQQLVTKIGSGSTPRGGKNSYQDKGISLVRSLNIHDDTFRYKNLAYLNADQAEKLRNVALQKDDVLLNITGASIARCNVVPNDILPARVNQHVMIIRPNIDVLLPGFLHYLLISKIYKDRLLSTGAGGGTTRQAITKTQIENFVITFPPVAEQKRIVGELDGLSVQTQKLQKLYQQKMDNLAELRQSILKQAFEGKL